MADFMDLEELAQYDSDEEGNSTDTNSHDRAKHSVRTSGERRAISTTSAAPTMKSGVAPLLLSGIRGKSSGETSRQTVIATPSDVFDRSDTSTGTHDGAVSSSVANTTRHKFSFAKKRALPPIPATGNLPQAVCDVLEEFYQAKGSPNKNEVTLLRALVGYPRSLPIKGRSCRIEGWFVRRGQMNTVTVKKEEPEVEAAPARMELAPPIPEPEHMEPPEQNIERHESDGNQEVVDHEAETSETLTSRPRKRRRRSTAGRGKLEDTVQPPTKRQKKGRPSAKEVAAKEATLWRGKKGEFEVGKILEHRPRAQGGLEYKVRWKGCGPRFDTWEPKANLSKGALEVYKQKCRRRAGGPKADPKPVPERAKAEPCVVTEVSSNTTAIPNAPIVRVDMTRIRSTRSSPIRQSVRKELIAAFDVNPEPTHADRVELAARVGISLEKVTTWFNKWRYRAKCLTEYPPDHVNYKQCSNCSVTTTTAWHPLSREDSGSVICNKCYMKHGTRNLVQQRPAPTPGSAAAPEPSPQPGEELEELADALEPFYTDMDLLPPPVSTLMETPVVETATVTASLSVQEPADGSSGTSNVSPSSSVACVDCGRPTANTCRQGLRLAICGLCQMYRNSHSGRSLKDELEDFHKALPTLPEATSTRTHVSSPSTVIRDGDRAHTDVAAEATVPFDELAALGLIY